MSTQNKQTWRIIALVLLAIAMIGPWTYDLIYVPAEYTCDRPNVRLEGDFCGLPLSLYWGFGAISMGIADLFSGKTPIAEMPSLLAYILLLLAVAMPLLTTIVLVWRNQARTPRLFDVIVWALGAVVAGLFLASSAPRPYAPPWGVLLYVVVAVVMLVRAFVSLRRGASPLEG